MNNIDRLALKNTVLLLNDRITAIVEKLNLKHPFEVKVDEQDEDCPMVVVDGWAYILPYFTGINCIGHLLRREIHYQIQREIYHPGVRYYPDGSGEPPSSDLVDIESFSDQGKAIQFILKMCFENMIEVAIQSEQEDRFAKEELVEKN